MIADEHIEVLKTHETITIVHDHEGSPSLMLSPELQKLDDIETAKTATKMVAEWLANNTSWTAGQALGLLLYEIEKDERINNLADEHGVNLEDMR